MSECIPWAGRINENGYGTIGQRLAHRVVWERERGPIPEGMTLDHTCHDPELCHAGKECPHRRCVNVWEHIEIVTAGVNRARGGAGGPASRKTHCPRGHAYEGENLLVSRGARYCRTCRTESRKKREAARKLATCIAAGHVPEWVQDSIGRVTCRFCLSKKQSHQKAMCGAGLHSMTGDNVMGEGRSRRCRACQNARQNARKRAAANARCKGLGHEPDLVESASGYPYCKICRKTRSGRPPKSR